jgi:hypothetical protein
MWGCETRPFERVTSDPTFGLDKAQNGKWRIQNTRQTSNDRDERHEETSWKPMVQNDEEPGRLDEIRCIKSGSISMGVKSETKHRRK